MILDTVDEKKKGVHTRYLILLIIFIVTAVNYADRATLSIAGTEVAKELQLSAVSMGYIFSAFGWAYLLMQIPGGWLLDKFGSKKFIPIASFSGRYSLSCKALLICSRWPGRDLHVLYALYARLLGSAIIPGERPYCRRLVPDERTWYCLRHL